MCSLSDLFTSCLYPIPPRSSYGILSSVQSAYGAMHNYLQRFIAALVACSGVARSNIATANGMLSRQQLDPRPMVKALAEMTGIAEVAWRDLQHELGGVGRCFEAAFTILDPRGTLSSIYPCSQTKSDSDVIRRLARSLRGGKPHLRLFA